ncbi:MAG: hypothetical protein H0T89_06430 [Deltaproteobacteria bacterium]|nr:hypothetical protein [Deltaproteobacteria bacterium]MDQ3295337.1 hypothetical protein [Myxococcota bacterium]
MCCFSARTPTGILARLLAPRVHVSATNIFTRMMAPGVQALAYGMNLASAREVAMILPLPVVPGSGDDAVRFVNLEHHPRMFEELAAMFAPIQALAKGGVSRSAGPRLVVHQIGAFIASYVPTRADFVRIDPQFRLPDVLFDAVPHYADYGFAVFQLAPGKVTVHPMAMTFPTRAEGRLFFPTVHVHDGRYHATARFDHALYYQHPRAARPPDVPQQRTFGSDEVSWATLGTDYEALCETGRPLLRRQLRARLPNQDTWIDAT